MTKTTRAVVGAAEHANTLVLVTVSTGGDVLDRRTLELTRGLSTHPHHHEGSWAVGRYLDSPWARSTSLEEAVALVKRVRAAAERGARVGLRLLERELGVAISAITLRACAPMPRTIAATIRDHRAQTQADSVLYRLATARAAQRLGWDVRWYEPAALSASVARPRHLGPPWTARHQLAAAAALALR